MSPSYPHLKNAPVRPPARATLIHCALRRSRYPPHALSHRETRPSSHISSFPVEEHHRHLWYRLKYQTQCLFLRFRAPSSYQVPLYSRGRVLGRLSLIIFLCLGINGHYKPYPCEWRIRPLHSLHSQEYDGMSRNSAIGLMWCGATMWFWSFALYVTPFFLIAGNWYWQPPVFQLRRQPIALYFWASCVPDINDDQSLNGINWKDVPWMNESERWPSL